MPAVDRELTVSGELRPMGFKQLDSLRVPISRSARPSEGTHRQPPRGGGVAVYQRIRLCQVMIDLRLKCSQSEHKIITVFSLIQPDCDQTEIVTLSNDVSLGICKIFCLLFRDVQNRRVSTLL